MLIFKILALPVVGILTLVTAFCSFALAISGAVLGIVSVIVFIIAVIMMTIPNIWGGIAWMVIAFLISPFGLPRLAEWLLEKIDDVNCVLKDFIFG